MSVCKFKCLGTHTKNSSLICEEIKSRLKFSYNYVHSVQNDSSTDFFPKI